MEKVTDIYWSIKKGSPQTTDCPENKRKSKQNRVRFCLLMVEMGGLEPPYHSLGLTPSTRLVCD